jgi:hypothetical protein
LSVVPSWTVMLPWTRRRCSVCVVWKWRPDVQWEVGGRWMVVLRLDEEVEG